MYKDRRANAAIVIGGIALMASGLWLVRTQVAVTEFAWMKAMIPHHSIAILTSERTNISDVRIKKLADGIMVTQRREIAEMEFLINDIQQKVPRTSRQ